MKIVGGVSSATVGRSTPSLFPPHIPDPETAILEEYIPHNQCLPGVAHTQHVSTANWDNFCTIDLTNQNSEPNPSPPFEFDIKHTTQNTRFEPTNQMNSRCNRARPHNEPPDDQTHSSSSPTNSATNLELFPRKFDQDTHKFQGTQTILEVDPSTHCHGNRIANKDLESKSLVDFESGESQRLSGKTVGRRTLKPLTSDPEDYCPPKKPKWSSTNSKDSFNLSPQTDQSDSSVCNFNQSNRSTSEQFPPVVAKLRPLVSFPSEFKVQTDQSDHSPESSVWPHDDGKNTNDDITSDLLLDSLSQGSDPQFSQSLDDSLWDIQIDQLDEFPGESSQSDSSVMHRRELAAFDQSDSRIQMQTNQAASSLSTPTNQSDLSVQMQTNQSALLPSTFTDQSDPSLQFQLHQSDYRSVTDPQPHIGKRKVTPGLMRKSKRAFNCPYTQSTVQEATNTSANVAVQPTHSKLTCSRGTFKVPLQTSGGVGGFAPQGSGSETPMCGPLRFPSGAEVSSSPTPHRHTVIPHTFTSAHEYRQVLTIAIRGMCSV